MAGRASAKRATYSPGRTDIERTSTGGTNFPVKAGQVWAVGPHQVACLDVTTPEYQRWIIRPGPRMVFCDPPWNNGSLKQAYAKAGHTFAPEFSKLVESIISIGRDHQIPVWMEMGRRSEGHVRSIIQAQHGNWCGSVPIVYHKTNPTLVMLATWGQGFGPNPALEGLDDNDVPQAVFTDAIKRGMLAPGDTVLDPTCGPNGATAKGALANDLRFVGSELSPWSVSSVLTLLVNLTGQAAQQCE